MEHSTYLARIAELYAAEVLGENGRPELHTREFVAGVYDAQLARLIEEQSSGTDEGREAKLRLARIQSGEMIDQGWFDPI